jgi:ribulose-bisphosphate carboxylase large chain
MASSALSVADEGRFEVSYRLFAPSQAEAERLAATIALENTLEVPLDVVPEGYIKDTVLGRVLSVTQEHPTQEHPKSAQGEPTWLARLSFHLDAVGYELTQMLNVIFGNASLFKGVKVIGTHLTSTVAERFPGARFGAEGVRALIGRERGGLLCAVVKPQGLSSEALAELCYRCARAGADLIKEDHGISNQPNAPFKERVKLCAQAVARANEERAAEGDPTRALYIANLGGHAEQAHELAYYAKEQGATALLVIPGLWGFDTMQRLARDASLKLPIMAHPSFLGPYVLSPNTGYTHGVLFGELMRLAGADISVFPNDGGRFGFSAEECAEIANACLSPQGHGLPILPSPGGGMSLARMPELRRRYGDHSVYLLGGSLLRLGDKLSEGIKATREALDASLPDNNNHTRG